MMWNLNKTSLKVQNVIKKEGLMEPASSIRIQRLKRSDGQSEMVFFHDREIT